MPKSALDQGLRNTKFAGFFILPRVTPVLSKSASTNCQFIQETKTLDTMYFPLEGVWSLGFPGVKLVFYCTQISPLFTSI